MNRRRALLILVLTALALDQSSTLSPRRSVASMAAIPGDWYVDGGAHPSGNTTRTITEAVARASAGQTIVVKKGIYRESIVTWRTLTLVAEPGATIKGSDLWSGFVREGSAWAKAYPYNWFQHGDCRAKSNGRCRLPDQVFIDGQPQIQETALSILRPGSFYVGGGKLYLGTDPTGREVEVSIRELWLKAEAPSVVVKGFRMTHSRVMAQWGALSDGGQPGVVFEGNDLSFAHGAAVRIDGDGTIVRANRIHDNGQIGIVGHGMNMLVEGNEISRNNTEDFDSGWEAGGTKFKMVKRLRVEGNESFENRGPGLWCDIDCDGVTFRGNRLHHNTGPGLQFEISFNCLVDGNFAWANGHGWPHWAWGAGILIQNSSGCEVKNNVVAWNAAGISVIQQNRGPRWTEVRNNHVHDNVVASRSNFRVVIVSDIGTDLGLRQNRAENNRTFFGPNLELARILGAAGVPTHPE